MKVKDYIINIRGNKVMSKRKLVKVFFFEKFNLIGYLLVVKVNYLLEIKIDKVD